MKNLKITLLYKITILLIITGIIIYRININKSKYSNETTIIGIINKISETKNKVQFELIGKEKILVIFDNKVNYKLGDKIKVFGKLEIPTNNTIPNLFNYKKYLKSKKINFIFKASKIELIKENKSLKYKIKNNLIEYINKYKTKNYLKTFIIGDNSEINKNIKNTFQSNGISHLFAISGMHLSLFASILLCILNKLKIKENINYIIIITFFIFFAFLTNYTPSVLRALILYILISINKILKLNIKAINLITIDLILLLIYNPFYIYNSGFLYSFIISITLILCSNLINRYKNYFKKILATSTISFLASIPISINSFNEINLLTPLYNLIFVPLISIILFPLSILTLIIKPLDNIFIILVKLLEYLSTMFSKIKISLILEQIPWYILIIYYISIIQFIKGLQDKKKVKTLFLIFLILIHYNIKLIKPIKRITTLDIGQGDSTVLEISNKVVLIDTGGNKNESITENKTIPYMKSQGIKKINYLVLTHGDFDHMGEAINLVNSFKVEKVIFNCGPYNDLEKDLIKVLDKKKIKYYSCIKELNIDNNKLYFLQTKEYDNENDNSNVIITELNGYKFMFMGDAGIEKEKDILDKYNISNVDVLKVGHHGSKTSSSKTFINEINPKYSIISVGKNNRYGHPNKEVLKTLEDSKIYRTDQAGSIMFKIKNNKLKIETCSS